MTEADRRALYRLVGGNGSPRATTDDLQSLLLQVVFALLMVFVIAYFLFVERQKKEREEAVMDLNRQKLTLALEKTAEDHRVRYGLNALMTQGTDGKRTFEPDDHVRDGQLVLAPAAKSAFASGSAAAFADYGDTAALAAAWREATLKEAGLAADALSEGEAEWLDGQVAQQVEAVRLDARGVQRALAARLQRQWIEHPEKLGEMRDVGAIADALKSRSLKLVSEAAGAAVLP